MVGVLVDSPLEYIWYLALGAGVMRKLELSSTQLLMSLFVNMVAVPPNHSLNRTHCGVPPFGLKKPSPNTGPPQ